MHVLTVHTGLDPGVLAGGAGAAGFMEGGLLSCTEPGVQMIDLSHNQVRMARRGGLGIGLQWHPGVFPDQESKP